MSPCRSLNGELDSVCRRRRSARRTGGRAGCLPAGRRTRQLSGRCPSVVRRSFVLPYSRLLSLILILCTAIVGVGTQFLCIASGILVMAVLGMFNVHRHGAINSAAILLYALTSCKLPLLTVKSFLHHSPVAESRFACFSTQARSLNGFIGFN